MTKCNLCDYSCGDPSNMRTHMKYVHGKQKFPCNLCISVFKWKKNLNRHIKIYHGESGPQLYPCLQCKKLLSRKQDLKRHINHVHGESNLENFHCPQCEYKTKRKDNLSEHVKNKHEKAEYKCDICNKTFNWKQSMMKHKKTHEKTKQDTHEQYEEGENPNKNHATGKPAQNNQEEIIQCPECDYITRRKYNISRHMKVHENKSERKEQKILDDIIFEMQEYNRKIELGRKI